MPVTACQVLRASAVLAITALLGACSSFDGASRSISSIVTPYQIDVVQGNVVSSEQVAALRTGMDRNTVRDILGTPLLQSVFHADRWDYIFTFRRKGQEPQQRKVAVFFKDNVLERFEADPLPSEAEFVASLDSGRKTGKVPNLVATEEELKKFEPAAKPAAAAAPAPKPAAPLPESYPPLETSAP
jgi:outer membrane protein assembly factor BamE